MLNYDYIFCKYFFYLESARDLRGRRTKRMRRWTFQCRFVISYLFVWYTYAGLNLVSKLLKPKITPENRFECLMFSKWRDCLETLRARARTGFSIKYFFPLSLYLQRRLGRRSRRLRQGPETLLEGGRAEGLHHCFQRKSLPQLGSGRSRKLHRNVLSAWDGRWRGKTLVQFWKLKLASCLLSPSLKLNF